MIREFIINKLEQRGIFFSVDKHTTIELLFILLQN